MEIHFIHKVLQDYKQVRATAVGVIKDAVKVALTDDFKANPEINSISFGVSTAPYNDENAGQGIYGPLFDEEVVTDFNRDREYNLFYDLPSQANSELGKVLNEAGWEFVGEALSVDSQEIAFVATRVSETNEFKLEEYSVEY